MMFYGVPLDVSSRVFSKIKKGTGDECWTWTGDLSKFGGPTMPGERQTWGRLYLTPKVAAYESTHQCNLAKKVGLSARCRNKLCCNPSHMEPVYVHKAFARPYVDIRNLKPNEAIVGCEKVNGKESKTEPVDVVGSMLRKGINIHDIAYVSGWDLDSIRRLSVVNRHVWCQGQREPKPPVPMV